MPEFIVGSYDAISGKFKNNPNYYEFLPQE